MPNNPLMIVAAVGAAAIATAIGVNVILWQDEAKESPVPETTAASDKAPAKATKDAEPESRGLPAFDVVRVGPNGDTVIAGRAKLKELKDKWTVVTKDKSLCAHFEHTIVVTDGEPIILTLP